MTQTRKEALIDLRDKVKAGDATNDGGMYHVFGDKWTTCFDAFHGSLDAAKVLHEAVMPDQGWEVYWTSKYPGMIPGSSPYAYRANIGWGSQTSGHSNSPARAWLLAIIEALIAQEE